MIAALAEEVSEKGFRRLTVAGIVKRAGVARGTFYEHFSSKEECFLATQELAMGAALERVVDRAGDFESWPRRVCAGLSAFLEFIDEEPALAKTCLVEALAAGPASLQYHEESQRVFVSLFRLGRDVSPHGAELPETLEEAIVGGVFWILYQRLLASGVAAIRELLPELTEFVLAPYLGPGAAREVADATGPENGETVPPVEL